MFKRKNRIPRRGEKGFTLIELLVVVAILGVLAAVVVPNVTRFMGTGKTQAGETELHNVQLAMGAMMADQGLSTVPAVLTTSPVQAMGTFPDTTAGASDVLFGGPKGNYIQQGTTNYWFAVDADGTVHGYWDSKGSAGTANVIGVNNAP